jgi:hypothetical protein
MTIIFPACVSCRHFHAKDQTGNFCDAFPDRGGIPVEIVLGQNRHIEPVKGDHGIQYEPFPGEPDTERSAPKPNLRVVK